MADPTADPRADPARPARREGRRPLDGRAVIVVALLAGFAAMAVAMLTGLAPDLLTTIATPAPIIRAALAGGAIVLGGWLLLSAVRKIDGSLVRGPSPDGARISEADLGTLVRGVRLVFLAAASLTAAAGWIIAEPLPLVIALVIAGVDVVETSFLLLVASRRDS